MKLLEFMPQGKFVFVGDTHGDLGASKKILDRHSQYDTKICFLGDYVDRGNNSKGNIDYLLEKRDEHPDNIFLLQGNHENNMVYPIHPAYTSFWNDLSSTEKTEYNEIFQEFPLAVSVGGIIALHGALPNMENVKKINDIPLDPEDSRWKCLLWGDYQSGYFDESLGCEFRPSYNEDVFEDRMKNLEKNVLIRSHQPDIPLSMFDGRCVTIFSSNAYGGERSIAIADFDKTPNVKTIDDLIIERI
jgi:hypothetical protein